ncbi:MAG: helix-turn-helix domain-containing protein, partial [Acetobacteraceae bacterium]
RRRLLGAALRRYREALGYGLEDAARVLDCDRSKISRIETGQRGIRVKELRELLTEYGVPEEEQAALIAVAHRAPQHGWWEEYRDVLPEAAQDYVVMEAAASEILAYEPSAVPDLLQTADYARAVADADPALASDVQRAHAVEVKLSRQRIVLGERRPRFDVVLGEGILHQSVGGTRLMRAQLATLAAIADEGEGLDAAVTLRVLPFAAGAYAAAGYGAMTILRFSETPSLGVIHLTALSGGVSLDGQEEVARYTRAFAQLRAAALAPASSARLLRKAAMG